MYENVNDEVIIKKYAKYLPKNSKKYSKKIIKLIFENSIKDNFFSLFYSIFRELYLIIYKSQDHEIDIRKAIQKKQLESVKFLIENNFYSFNDEEVNSLANYSFECQSYDIYNYFMKYFQKEFLPIKEKPKDYEKDIFKACEEGKLTSVQWLIEQENVDKYKKRYRWKLSN